MALRQPLFAHRDLLRPGQELRSLGYILGGDCNRQETDSRRQIRLRMAKGASFQEFSERVIFPCRTRICQTAPKE